MGIINVDRLALIAEAGSVQEKTTLSHSLLAACDTYHSRFEGAWVGPLAYMMRERYPEGPSDPYNSPQLDRESALQVYQQLRELVVDRGYVSGKAMRPWEVDSEILGSLDPNQPWWGFEFETGYATHDERTEVINHTWDTWDGVTFDAEGEGNYGSEITFVPANLSSYDDGTAPAIEFMKYISDNRLGMRTTYDMIGTHINLSVPEMRGNVAMTHAIARALNLTLSSIPMTNGNGEYSRLALFGRARLYAGFFSHGNYIEGKLFRTTYSLSEFERYMKVCGAITRVAQSVARTLADPMYRHQPVTLFAANFVEMVDNPALEPVLMSTHNASNIDINGSGSREALLAASTRVILGSDLQQAA